MCNLFRMKNAPTEIADLFSNLQTPISVRFPEGPPNLEPRDEIRITDSAAILTMGDAAFDLVQRRWSWPGPTGKPVFNFRSEGRKFPQASRCVIPTDGFYEFTSGDDPKSKRKDRWLFTMPDHELFFIAGHMHGQAWTMLTTEPGPDVAPFHLRQIVVLDPAGAADWLKGGPETELLRAPSAGTLKATKALPAADVVEPAAEDVVEPAAETEALPF